jgi:hypothetical protein
VVVLEATFSGLYGGCVVVLEAIVASASPAAPRPRRPRAAARPPPVAGDVGTCRYRTNSDTWHSTLVRDRGYPTPAAGRDSYKDLCGGCF